MMKIRVLSFPDSKVHGANMGPTWVLSAPDGPMSAPWTLLSRLIPLKVPISPHNLIFFGTSFHTRSKRTESIVLQWMIRLFVFSFRISVFVGNKFITTWNTGPHWIVSLQRHHNERDGVSNHQPYHCLLNRLFRCRSKKTSKVRVTGFCARNSPVTGEFLTQRASNAENVTIWWRHHVSGEAWCLSLRLLKIISRVLYAIRYLTWS